MKKQDFFPPLIWIATGMSEVQSCPTEIAYFSKQILRGGREEEENLIPFPVGFQLFFVNWPPLIKNVKVFMNKKQMPRICLLLWSKTMW